MGEWCGVAVTAGAGSFDPTLLLMDGHINARHTATQWATAQPHGTPVWPLTRGERSKLLPHIYIPQL